ncbi:unnamed protein product [Rotaria socialis]|uniref:NAD(+)--protein-arginine ADP-ribosyltransferase n=2 Tax=Rotaria socialis TaxID=392032 RepID=A0A819YWN1_9BILA|nr:unnamed protein product [Rotaria socialis]CAF3281656.1 unnamed protein product [Rotaria socialis]CAF3416181.1 unnamed protein product [Rotaria socialis]CAF4160888.1 unnamed protein product [Rotaria socialis]CAF4645646.1 unnamed protein product [Rotaria socialis]
MPAIQVVLKRTALHAAAFYGHLEIVKLILKHGCSTTTINKYKKTAAEECNDTRIRQLIQSSQVPLGNNVQPNDEVPQMKWAQIYENRNHEDESTLATKVMKLRLTTYLTNQFKIDGANRTDHVKKVILQAIDRNNHNTYQFVLSFVEKFEETQNPEHLMVLYASETPFYSYINIYPDERFFAGSAYRDISLRMNQLEFYVKTRNYPRGFIEMRTINGASKSRRVAETYAYCSRPQTGGVKALFIIDFNEPCETAIDVTDLFQMPIEEEVLIVPGTFFEVKSVEISSSDHDSSDMAIIKLKNIPVSRNVLLQTIKELK